MWFEIYEDQDNPGQWRWRLRPNDEEIIAVPGEGHKTRSDCLHDIRLVKNSTDAPIYDEKGERIAS